MAVSLSHRTAHALGGTIQVDGKLLLLEKGFLVTGKTLFVPASAVMKALGGTVQWDGESRYLLEAGGRAILLTTGEAEAQVNGFPVSLSAPVQVQDGELYVPASFLIMQFSPHLRIEHPALKDAQAMALLAKAAKTTPVNYDVQTETRLVFEEPGMLWMAFKGQSERQVRGQDLFETGAMKGPMGLNETQETAARDGKWYSKVNGFWQEMPDGPGAMGAAAMLPVAAPVPTTPSDLGLQALTMLAVEARLGEPRTEGSATLQDIYLTLDFGPLLGAVRAETGGDALMQRSEAVVTVDAATGRVVSMQLGLALFMAMPLDGENVTLLRLELDARDTITPNNKPIAWPEALD